jgi:hypothetical protein
MGQECSCLNYRQRRYRRTSDDPYPNHSDEEELQEGNQIDIMLDSHCENTSLLTAIADTTFSTTNESISMDDRLTKRDSTNKMSPYSSSSFNVSSSSCVHPSGPHKDDTTRSTSSKSNINLEVLRSYQKTTGIVRHPYNLLYYMCRNIA